MSVSGVFGTPRGNPCRVNTRPQMRARTLAFAVTGSMGIVDIDLDRN